MAITRLKEGFGIAQDSCISGIHPMRESDPPGVYLADNPAAPHQKLFITYWEAVEVASKIGYPQPEVYEAQKAQIDAQAREIVELKRQLDEEVNDLKLKAVLTAVTNSKKDVLNAVEGYSSAVRARVQSPGKAAGSVPSKSAIGPGK